MKVSIENFRKKALAVVAAALATIAAASPDIKEASSLMEKGHYAEAFKAYEKIVFAFDGSPVTDGNRAQALLDAPRGGEGQLYQ